MRAGAYRQTSSTEQKKELSNPILREALAKQAAARPALGAPRAMPITPTLPRMPKPKRKRRLGK